MVFIIVLFEKVICHSLAAKQGILALSVKAPILVVPHGIYDIFDLTNISQDDARNKIAGIVRDDFVILFFGHLEPRKGLLEFLACAKQMENRPHFKFLLAGSNSVAGHASRYAMALEESRNAPNVILHDRRIPFEEVENYIAASNVIALPYLEGTTSGVLKIALAFSKPVIATRVGDFPEQIPAGAGVIIENDSCLVDSLMSALLEVENNYASYKQAMSEAGQDAQWSIVADKIIKFIGFKS
ncbi:glycosyltransferase [Deefgea sp. CFH1-16]|uniref:glycosyltransferase n=1 Tax=Deefgea sp. CFH1-16 TaxID=2675457 RepID=UPI0015F40E90|nr:glycosyltransferase [Deefgea sp. CFH1-16]